MFTHRLFYFLIFAFVSISSQARVSLPAIFSDNMVLQQKANAPVWGVATPGKTVEVITSWNKRTYRAKADANGRWKIDLITPAYGGPYSIKVSEENTIEFKNVLLGDVWLCSGQSNMEMPLAGWGKILNYEQEIANANYPNIRLLQAIHVVSNQPLQELQLKNNGWDICNPKNIAAFSSTAYFFAREIYNKTKIPIGLIHSSWGGTIAEAWTSYETLITLPDFEKSAKTIRALAQPPSVKNIEEQLKVWEQKALDNDAGLKDGKPVWAANELNTSDWKEMALPDTWENKGLPDFDGVVWFRKKINLPADWQQDITLHFTADDEDITYFNGEEIGATKGWNTDRAYKIPKELLRNGDNIIVVRVFDTGGGGGIYGENNSLYLKNTKGEKLGLSGKWDYKIGLDVKKMPPMPGVQEGPNRPTVLYNAMIHPLINYAIKGAIWYQGESNAGRAYQYRTLFPAMIKDWRSKFSSGDFPFYFVQLANFMKREDSPGPSAWAELREAQLMTTSLKNTGMATIIDIGDALDIHPKNKQEVGRRLALIALNKVYAKGNEYSGPLYNSYKIEGNKIKVHFGHAKGLQAKDGGIVKGFSIAGADKKFYWAAAKIEGNTIVLSSPEVKNPVAVRYGWANNPDVNLINSDGLPASPFRTDNWAETTVNNK